MKSSSKLKFFKKSALLAVALLIVIAAVTLVACDGTDEVILSFEANGGEEVPRLLADGEYVYLPELDPMTNNSGSYVFEGWSANADLSGELYRGKISSPKSNTTYYAVWARGYKLTLDAGSGRLSKEFIYLKSGESLSDALKKYTPAPKEGLSFYAWFFNGSGVNANSKMPETDATVVARYNVGYSIKYFKQTSEGDYEEDVELRESLTGVAGMQASIATPKTLSGYMFNQQRSADTTRIQLSEDASQNELACYYDINGYHIRYNPAPPYGTVARGSMNDDIADFDGEANALDCEFTVEGYRFLGWAAFEGGIVMYEAGDPLPLSAISRDDPYMDLYAVWQRGKADALGGGDYIFIDEEDDSIVYLMRTGIEQKQGVYNSETGVFSFEEAGRNTLRGIISGDYFYYYNEGLYTQFKSTDGKHTIDIQENYAATYTNDSGVTRNGQLSFDPEWGYYVFRSSDESGDYMLRFQFVENEAGETVFALQNMDEAGYYATKDGYPVIYLDGLGGLRYYFDPAHPTYYDIAGEPVLEAIGVYTVNDKGYYQCSTYVGENVEVGQHLEDFLFRMTSEQPKQVGDYEIKAIAIERSTLYGQLSNELYLDGFGGGTYTETVQGAPVQHVGTYEIIHNWWMTLDSRDALETWLINFTYDGATEDIYFALTEDNRGNLTAELFGKVSPKGDVGGLAIFDGPITIGGEVYDDSFIMFIIDDLLDTSMVLVKMDEQELSSGEMAAIYAPMYNGKVTPISGMESFYHFEGAQGTPGALNFQLREDGKAVYSEISGEGSLDKRTIDASIELVADPATSTASYTDAQGVKHDNIPYTYSGGEFVEFYTFKVDANTTFYYYKDMLKDADGDYKRVPGENILEYDFYTESLMYVYRARLLLAPDSNDAYVALPMSLGEAAYVGAGTYTQVSAAEYKFEASKWDDDLIEYFGGEGFEDSEREFHGNYDSFVFKKEGGDQNEFGKFYARFDDMYFDLQNFKADGYRDTATYTTDNGIELTGTFYRMETIIVFEYNETRYYLKEEKDSSNVSFRMKNVSEDAGLYYFYDIDNVTFETFGPDSSGTYTDYLVFDGESRVTMVSFENGYVPNPKEGAMTKTDKWTEDFREYQIVMDSTTEVFKVLLSTFTSIWQETFLVYDQYNEAMDGEMVTSKFGTLSGNGYRIHSASYDEDGDGTADYFGVMTRATFDKTDFQTHAYTIDPNGDVMVFTYDIDEETSNSIVFDIRSGDQGYEYLVERELRFGAYAFWDKGERPGRYMYLDGSGHAEIYEGDDTLLSKGVYRAAPEIGEVAYLYESEGTDGMKFYFATAIESQSIGTTYFEYRMMEEEVEGEYDTTDDWSHLSISGFGEITYIDRYGVVYEGYYDKVGNNITLITHDGSRVTISFTIDFATKKFQFVSKDRLPAEEEA